VLASGRHDPTWLPYLVGHGLTDALVGQAMPLAVAT
jgi:hypothetical protein